MARIYAPNGRHYKKEAEGMPLIMIMKDKDGEYDMLTHQERAFLKMTRAIPDDLRPKFDELLGDNSRPMKDRMDEFAVLMKPRRAEFRARWERLTRGESLDSV